jgi:hypothetical protein
MTTAEAETAPECPKGHGPMILRPGGTPEQRWCGTWYECAPVQSGCRSAVLYPSPELTDALEVQRP